MKKYLVVSYDPDQQQWFYDIVFANDADAAKERVLSLRDYCVDADTFAADELAEMSERIKTQTLEQCEKWLAELADERDAHEDAKQGCQ